MNNFASVIARRRWRRQRGVFLVLDVLLAVVVLPTTVEGAACDRVVASIYVTVVARCKADLPSFEALVALCSLRGFAVVV